MAEEHINIINHLEKSLREVILHGSGGHTSIKDMLFFEHIKEDDTCLWYSGKTENGFTFIVFGTKRTAERG